MRLLDSLNNRIIALLIVAGLALSLSGIHVTSAHAENTIPEYTGAASVVLNGNIPSFSTDEITAESFEKYGNLDKLGRCTPAIASVGKDIMPTEERGSIGSVKPTGWNQNKYPGIVNSEPPYLYNRCHLIGYQLTGENANEKNLITGTRYMNIEGMLPYENKVADYVRSTGNHVMYRVTPVFSGNNLLCDGVQIEALSVEDNGKGIRFNVFCYNVQPGILINYTDGSNQADPSYNATSQGKDITNTDNSSDQVDRSTPSGTTSGQKTAYVANKNTKKFHYPSCSSVSDMKEKNKLYYEGTREELIEQGYDPCKRCNP